MRSRSLFVILILAAVAICLRLGAWQLGRLQERRAANASARQARALPPIILPGNATPFAGGRVEATGVFDLEREFVLRGRANGGAPGVEIATPLRFEGRDTALLVIRGFVPSDDATSVDLTLIREEGVRTARGIAFPLPLTADSGAPNSRQGAVTWRRLDARAVAARLPYPVYPVAIWQEQESTMQGMPIRTGAPGLDDGPHLSYAIQWFAFAVIFAVGGIAYLLRTRNEGRGTDARA